MKSNHSLIKSFGFAFEGLKVALLKGRNFRIQVLSGVFAITLGLILKLNALEWLVIVITIATVLILELLNTSIEAVVDLITQDIHPKAKLAKDVAAGAVLISSLGSVVIAALIFIPKILAIL